MFHSHYILRKNKNGDIRFDLIERINRSNKTKIADVFDLILKFEGFIKQKSFIKTKMNYSNSNYNSFSKEKGYISYSVIVKNITMTANGTTCKSYDEKYVVTLLKDFEKEMRRLLQ